MFDSLFGPSAADIQRANEAHAINHMALLFYLIEKGLLTEADADLFQKCRTKAMHVVEQDMAKKREEAIQQFDEQFPNVRKMFGSILGEPGEAS